jgi:hypothetical protein
MYLGLGPVRNFRGSLLLTQPQLVPAHDTSHGNASARDPRAATAYLRRTCDQSADIDHSSIYRSWGNSFAPKVGRPLASISMEVRASCGSRAWMLDRYRNDVGGASSGLSDDSLRQPFQGGGFVCQMNRSWFSISSAERAFNSTAILRASSYTLRREPMIIPKCLWLASR